MPQIDLLLAAELLVVLPIVTTMDCLSPQAAAKPPVKEPMPAAGWTVETDLHAQRILRLERRRAETSATRA